MSWMSWNFMRIYEIYFQTDAESFSFLILEKNKVSFQKKIFFGRSLYAKIIPKDGASRPNFQWRFWFSLALNSALLPSSFLAHSDSN